MLDALHKVFSVICHQSQHRSPVLADGVILLCARCIGIYGGVLCSALVCICLRCKDRLAFDWRLAAVFGLTLLACPFEIALERFAGVDGGNQARLATGFLSGIGLSWFLWLPLPRRGQRKSSRRRSDNALPLAAVVVLTGLFFLLLTFARRDRIWASILGILLVAGVLLLVSGVIACIRGMNVQLMQKG
jgi:uncharacterized membrane protein